MLTREPLLIHAIAHTLADLGGQHDLLAMPLDHPPDNLLRAASGVDLDSRAAQKAIFHILHLPPAKCEVRGMKAEFRNSAF